MAEPVKMGAENNIPNAWIKGVESADFKTLVSVKKSFIVPMVIIYLVVFMGMSYMLAFQRPLMGTKVFGPLNLGYTLIIANYFMAWIIAILYARVSSNDHDPLLKTVIDNARKSGSKS